MNGDWTLHQEGSDSITSPTWPDVERAIRALDGTQHTLLSLRRAQGDCLMVGGGEDGRFLVDYLADEDTQEDYVLVDPAIRGKAQELLIGGQLSGPYPAWTCVALPLALRAAHALFTTGRFSSDLIWTDLALPEHAETFDPSRRAYPPGKP